MNINTQLMMGRLQPSNLTETGKNSLTNVSNKNDFFDTLSSSLASLEDSQMISDRAIEGLVTGEADNLHQVMIKTSEAQISLELAVQLRNKCLEAMNEIKGMQF